MADSINVAHLNTYLSQISADSKTLLDGGELIRRGVPAEVAAQLRTAGDARIYIDKLVKAAGPEGHLTQDEYDRKFGAAATGKLAMSAVQSAFHAGDVALGFQPRGRPMHSAEAFGKANLGEPESYWVNPEDPDSKLE